MFQRQKKSFIFSPIVEALNINVNYDPNLLYIDAHLSENELSAIVDKNNNALTKKSNFLNVKF
jgi:hypothetical protein